jgi:uncharacterized membrane protein YgdD (TMEM256/DUF423 family)
MKLSATQTLIAGALLALLSVAFGAFGAHALKPLLTSAQQGDNFELAVRYQFFHALALLFVGLWMRVPAASGSFIPVTFLAGIALFCGGLYAVSLGGPAMKPVAAVIPVGGVLFLIGWGILLFRLVKNY